MPKSKNSHILVIDDEQNTLDFLQEALQLEDYTVFTATDGLEGFEKFRKQEEVGVVLTDLLMPGMNGMEFLAKAKALDPYVEVIVLTGMGGHENVIEALKKGAFDYLMKPTNIDELFLTVRRAFERRRLYEENQAYQENLEKLVADRTAELTETKNFLQTVLDSSEDYSLIATDLDGTITLFNRGSEKFLGYGADEVIGKESVLLFTPESEKGKGPLRDLGGKKLKAETYEREKRVKRKDGELRTINLSVTTLRDEKNKIVGHLGISKDITEEKKLQEEIKKYTENLEGLVRERTDELATQNEELQKTLHKLHETQDQLIQSEKLASLGQLSAGIAHEINNPLGFIHSNISSLRKYVKRLSSILEFVRQESANLPENGFNSELMKRWKKEKIDFILPDLENLLDESMDGTQRVRTIVQDLKSFSNVNRAQITYSNIPASLESTLNIARNEFKYKAEVFKEFDEGIPEVRCNLQQLNQVFLNMIVNAAQSIEKPPGRIDIRVKKNDDETIRIEIEDNGTGIKKKDRKKIFDPFFTTKDVGSGTGLGLSISYRIIKDHGGNIEVDTYVGRGTKFIITLPVDGPKIEEDESEK
ncbi:response regulator [bacterium]|nr:response regulator [bacterium]